MLPATTGGNMDKDEFLRVAPEYYLLALFEDLEGVQNYITDTFLYSTSNKNSFRSVLKSETLMKQAVETLIAAGILVETKDPFGPTLYRRLKEPYQKFKEVRINDQSSLFFRYRMAPNSGEWLATALANLSVTYDRLGLTDEEVQADDREWEPLPLDRDSETVKQATAAVDKTIIDVEQNNGYGIQHPEERDWVLSNLKMVSERLHKAATITVGYIRAHGLNVLTRLQERFTDAAIGEIAKQASHLLVKVIGELLKNLL